MIGVAMRRRDDSPHNQCSESLLLDWLAARREASVRQWIDTL
jgi:hypothetical protein